MRIVLLCSAYVALSVATYLTYRAGTDHSVRSAVSWGLLYLWAVVVPGIWGFRMHRAMERWEHPPPAEGRLLPWAPVMIGALVLANVLILFWRLADR